MVKKSVMEDGYRRKHLRLRDRDRPRRLTRNPTGKFEVEESYSESEGETPAASADATVGASNVGGEKKKDTKKPSGSVAPAAVKKKPVGAKPGEASASKVLCRGLMLPQQMSMQSFFKKK
jgi:hypothetical protein